MEIQATGGIAAQGDDVSDHYWNLGNGRKVALVNLSPDGRDAPGGLKQECPRRAYAAGGADGARMECQLIGGIGSSETIASNASKP